MPRVIHISALVSLLLGLATIHLLPADARAGGQAFENRPGWTWLIRPFPREDDADGPLMESNNGLIVLVEEGKQQELIVVFAHPGEVEGYHQLAPVAFDADGKRHALRPRLMHLSQFSETHPWTGMQRWGSHPKMLRAAQVTHVGLEGMTVEAHKVKLKNEARLAIDEAKKIGLDVLPFPVLDKPYTFQLPDVTGQRIDSNELNGKVVLLDFWATWCHPCMKKMPELKELHERWHDRGLEVVGINLDEDVEICREAIEQHDIPWRQSRAPTDKILRAVWMNAMGFTSIPRLLLIDRQGHLRADCKPEELEEEVIALMSE